MELKEFYKSTHPIYLTLTEQKDLQNKIDIIESDINTQIQRKLENLKGSWNLFWSSQWSFSSEINLAMAEASSIKYESYQSS